MSSLDGLAGLSERYDAIQVKTFTRWWNLYLKERQLKLEELCEDIRSGVPGILLLEVLTSTTGTKYNKKPKSQFQRLENCQTFLDLVKARGVKLVNIGAEDLHDGKKKLVLGLTWTLILKYEIHQFGIDENMILKWVRLRVGEIEVTSWGESFRDGLVFCALIQHHEPGAIDMGALNPNDPMTTLQVCRQTASPPLSHPVGRRAGVGQRRLAGPWHPLRGTLPPVPHPPEPPRSSPSTLRRRRSASSSFSTPPTSPARPRPRAASRRWTRRRCSRRGCRR